MKSPKLSSNKTHSFTYNGNQASIYVSSGAYVNVSCTYKNSCGTSPTLTFNCYNYSYYRMVASPNPANLTLTVEAQPVTESEATNTSEKLLKSKDKDKIQAKLVDKSGNIKAEGKLKDGILKMNTNNLPEDTYFLQIFEDEELIVKQIVIRH